MLFFNYISLNREDNAMFSRNLDSLNDDSKKNQSYKIHKSVFFLIILFLNILSNNIDLEYLSNDFFLSTKKNYHLFSKYFKKNIYNINNNNQTKKISLVNEIFYLYDIRKQINIFKEINSINIHLKKFKRVVHPKISLILTVFNQEQYIYKIYSCILNQTFKDIEIIFIDDNSTDNSDIIIKKLMELDKRIIYIKNKSNKGQFYSRNYAALLAKGKYILIVDPDDFLLNNILIKCYKAAKKFNLDIIQFYHVMGNFSQNHLYILNQISKPIMQPKTKTIFFNNPTRYLWDKLLKKEIVIKSIYFMHEKYRNERFIIHNDETVCFGIFKTANFYGQIEEIGYFYNRNISNSTTSKNFIPENINGRFHCIFTIMEYYFEQSLNNYYEKVNGGYKFFTFRILRRYKDKIKYLTNGFDFINDVINIYLKCEFFDKKQKHLLKQFKSDINHRKYMIQKI